ncbi:MAG: hypothetical protein GY757_07190, partial [bacterium]|nr:hypothetical protein [bacterium]
HHLDSSPRFITSIHHLDSSPRFITSIHHLDSSPRITGVRKDYNLENL